MRRRGSQLRRTLVGLLAGGAVGLLLLLALPGVASADPAADAPAATVTPSTETTPVEAVPGDDAPPPAEEAPPAEETPGVPVDDGSAPPVTDDGAAAPPAPPPSESAPVVPDPSSDGSTPAPQPVEVTPSPSSGGGLPVAPDTPAPAQDKLPAAALSASTWDAPQAPVTLPKGPEAHVAAAVAATEPSAPAPAAAPKRTDEAAPPPARDLTRFSFDASGQAVQAITPPRPEPELSFADPVRPPESLTVELVAPPGAAGSGSSLLAVLAGYILPGSGPAPPATLLMLVLLGLILAAVYAPRPAGSERIWLSGLLGPSAGHDMAVRRPG